MSCTHTHTRTVTSQTSQLNHYLLMNSHKYQCACCAKPVTEKTTLVREKCYEESNRNDELTGIDCDSDFSAANFIFLIFNLLNIRYRFAAQVSDRAIFTRFIFLSCPIVFSRRSRYYRFFAASNENTFTHWLRYKLMFANFPRFLSFIYFSFVCTLFTVCLIVFFLYPSTVCCSLLSVCIQCPCTLHRRVCIMDICLLHSSSRNMQDIVDAHSEHFLSFVHIQLKFWLDFAVLLLRDVLVVFIR